MLFVLLAYPLEDQVHWQRKSNEYVNDNKWLTDCCITSYCKYNTKIRAKYVRTHTLSTRSQTRTSWHEWSWHYRDWRRRTFVPVLVAYGYPPESSDEASYLRTHILNCTIIIHTHCIHGKDEGQCAIA
jgi:hypothetical protein